MALNLSPTQIAFNARGNGQFRLPFDGQIRFFRAKTGLPSQHFDDVINQGHDKAFIMAGATKADLVNDLLSAVDKAIADGQGIDVFRQRFNDIVAKHGWTGWRGEGTEEGVKWRTRVIYDTNVSTSYAAGRWAQLNDPKLLAVRPFWKYIHSDTVKNPRPLHVSWNGLVLRHDDPWWLTHYPPNGWMCHCRVMAVSADQYTGQSAPDDGVYTKTDRYGTVHTIPNGIDYTFDYAPGANAAKPLMAMVDDKLVRLPAAIGSDLMQALVPVMQAERNAAYRQWLEAIGSDRVIQNQTVVVGAIGSAELAWLQQARDITPLTAEIAIGSNIIIGPKAIRHAQAGDGIPLSVWHNLPEALLAPIAVLFDNRSGNLLYILAMDTSRKPQLAVEFDFQVKKPKSTINMIVSGYMPELGNLKARLKGGTLTLVSGSLGE